MVPSDAFDLSVRRKRDKMAWAMEEDVTRLLVLQLRYGLPLYAYLIRRTGTFIFPYSNLATPLFPNGTPLFHISTYDSPLFRYI